MDSSVLGFLKCMDGYIWSHLRYQTPSAPTRFWEILRYHGYYARKKKSPIWNKMHFLWDFMHDQVSALWPQQIPLAPWGSRHFKTPQNRWRSTIENNLCCIRTTLFIWWICYLIQNVCSQFSVPISQLLVPSYKFSFHSSQFTVSFYLIPDLCTLIPDPWFLIPVPWSMLPVAWSLIPKPWSLIPKEIKSKNIAKITNS